MSRALAADIIGYFCAVLTAAMATLQAVRIRQHGLEGVSVTTWALIACLTTFWLVYGIGTDLMPITVGNAAALAAICVTLWAIGIGRVLRALPLPALGVFLLTGVPLLIWGWDAGVPGAGVVAIGLAVPQIAALYKTQTAAGVSANAWITACAATAIWVVYGVLVRKYVMVFTDIAIVGVDLVIVGLTLARHRKLAAMEAAAASA